MLYYSKALYSLGNNFLDFSNFNGKCRYKTTVSAMIKMKIKSYTMKFYSRVIWRPICFVIFIVITLTEFLPHKKKSTLQSSFKFNDKLHWQGLSTYMIIELCKMNKKVEKSIRLDSYGEQNRIFSGIESTAKLLLPLNSSAINLERALSSSLNGTHLTYSNISTMVSETTEVFVFLFDERIRINSF